MQLVKEKIEEYCYPPDGGSWCGEKKSESRKKRKGEEKIENGKRENSGRWKEVDIDKEKKPEE